MSLSLRPYQRECVERAVAGNTIVSLPTGAGKTLVAVSVLDHFVKSGRVLFVVPTVVLVKQQAEYCRQHCQDRPKVVELCGSKMESWTEQKWQSSLRDNDVLVGTPEVFRRSLVDNAFISGRDFALIIFDECHNATGNSPMASMMRDAIHPLWRMPDSPRILGLTASFVNGSLKNLEKKRQDLEALMLSSLFCPDVSPDAQRSSEQAVGPCYQMVPYGIDSIKDALPLVEKKLDQLFSKLEGFGVPIKDTKKVITRTCHVLQELGMSSFLFNLREGVIPQLEAHADELSQLPAAPQQLAARLRQALPQLRQQLRETADALSSDGSLTALPLVSSKAEALLDLVKDLFQRHPESAYRGIIFVTQISLTAPLAHILNHHFRDDARVNTGFVTGRGSMVDAQRSLEMERFRSGETSVLVCTNALEEGVDVSDCAFVIRFNHFDTTKSHIQGSGRARRAGAEVFYFDNDPTKEQNGASLLADVAKDLGLALTSEDMTSRRYECANEVPGVYPFRPGQGAEVNFFNCLQIVYEFVARTMRQSFNPEGLYEYREEVVCEYPREVRKFLSEFRYPSPDGIQVVTLADVNAHWGTTKLDDVLSPDRTRNMDTADKEQRRVLFVVAIDMHRKGYLDGHNQPSARALAETRGACPAYSMAPRIKIKNTFAKEAVVRDNPQGPQSARPGAGVHPQPNARPANVDDLQNGSALGLQPGANPPPQSNMPCMNFKGVLNEWALGLHRKPAQELLSYETLGCNGGFQATVSILFQPSSHTGIVQPTKRAAEQDAARQACADLGLLP